MKKLILLLTLVFLTGVSGFGQEIDVRNVEITEFPEYKADLWVRNPNGIDSSAVLLSEDGKKLEATFLNGEKAEFGKNRSVLFLVLNHQAHQERTQWYKSIISNALENNLVKDGDEFSIVSFDCNRPEYGKGEKHILVPAEPTFTSDKEKLSSQVNDIDINQKRLKDNCLSRGDIYGAIYEALEVYGAHKTDLPKSIVVFADDLSLIREINRQGIIERSREQNIPIYAITYYQNINRKFGVEHICIDTYGSYYLDPTNDANAARDALFEFVQVMPELAAGKIYPFQFKSSKEKTGEKETVKVTYKGEVTAFEYESPSLNIFEWIEQNMILSIILFLFLIAIIFMIVLVRKKNERIKEQEELQRKEELARIESEQKANADKVQEQQLRIEEMKRAEQERNQKEQKNAEEEKLKKINEEKLIEMKRRGNLPWFTYDHHGEKGSFEMNFPVFTIGRNKNNSYQLDIPIVSGSHLQVDYEDGKYYVTDLNSTNGTYINGEKITKAEIRHGDVIIVGDINLTFHI